MIKNISKKYLFILLLIGVLLPYSNTLRNGFTWDDFPLIEKDERIRGTGNIPHIFSSDFWPSGGGTDEKLGYYRPAVTVSYLIDYSLWGLRPRGYHFSNILYHLIATLLLFLILDRVCKNGQAAFYASLLFAIHPIHTEAVAPIWGRTDLLCGLFYFASISMYLLSQKNIIHYAISPLFFMLALLSKEMAISLPLAVIGCDYMMGKNFGPNGNLRWRRYLGFAVAVAIYLGARYHAMGTLLVSRNSEFLSWPQKICLMMASAAFYLKSFYLPLKLNAYPVFDVNNGLSLFLKTTAVIVAFATVVTMLSRKKKNLTGLAFAGLALIPVLWPGSVGGVTAAERFLYIPSAGLCLFTIQSMEQLPFIRERGKLAICIGAILLALIAVRTYVRNFDWENDYKITVKTIDASPKAVFPRLNLAGHYERLLKYQDAIGQYHKVINCSPNDITAYFRLAYLYNVMGAKDSSLVYYNKVIELNPSFAFAYNNMANIYFVERNNSMALYFFKKAQQFDTAGTIIDPYSLGQVYLFENHPDSAIKYLSRFADKNNNIAHCYLLLGFAYKMYGDSQQAIRMWNKYIDLSQDIEMVEKIKNKIKEIQ
ncbi:tetratricopeptide repeat protein [candidate division TA06 bacterium]|uniref:Tetratricopeptide repeat protein n=1 Tax=candidate division TA06 bacterium TaxID=2250710 RepID=A0A933MIT5_UNCT6|nr:tetratricopeptide repeat protein [candidate division TA06 bacterium]